MFIDPSARTKLKMKVFLLHRSVACCSGSKVVAPASSYFALPVTRFGKKRFTLVSNIHCPKIYNACKLFIYKDILGGVFRDILGGIAS